MKNLRELSLPELQTLMKDWNEPSFRAKQIDEWLWKKFVGVIDDMSSLSKSLREKLKENPDMQKEIVKES